MALADNIPIESGSLCSSQNTTSTTLVSPPHPLEEAALRKEYTDALAKYHGTVDPKAAFKVPTDRISVFAFGAKQAAAERLTAPSNGSTIRPSLKDTIGKQASLLWLTVPLQSSPSNYQLRNDYVCDRPSAAAAARQQQEVVVIDDGSDSDETPATSLSTEPTPNLAQPPVPQATAINPKPQAPPVQQTVGNKQDNVHPFFQQNFGKKSTEDTASAGVPTTLRQPNAVQAPPLPVPKEVAQQPQQQSPTSSGQQNYFPSRQPLQVPPQLPPTAPVVHQYSSTSMRGFRPPAQRTNAPGEQPLEGFVSAQVALERDIKAGKTVAPPRRGPQFGLSKRQPYNAPMQESDETGTRRVGIDKVMNSTVRPNQKPNNADDDEGSIPESLLLPDGSIPPQLQGLEPKLVEQVAREQMESGNKVEWEDIAGLQHAKSAVEEAIVWPLTRPDLFNGLRDPPRGLLLFGPPGTGKTMIARAIATKANCSFFNISASSLMSKWIGEGEKLVRCLFAVASVRQPSVVFIDEIDSLLTSRSEGEQEASRRMKTEFLVQLDGVGTTSSDRILVIGATNRPQELDEAARRRMEQRLYIPLPDEAARTVLVESKLQGMKHTLTKEDFVTVAKKSAGYSGADMKGLCRDAAMAPIRELAGSRIGDISKDDIRPVTVEDMLNSLARVKPSVGKGELVHYVEWNRQFGSFADLETEE